MFPPFEKLSILEPIKSLIRTTILTLSTSTLNFFMAIFCFPDVSVSCHLKNVQNEVCMHA